MEDIKNKIAIVTGGNKGIGKAIAFLLAKRGASVTICGRSTESLDTTCKEIRDGGGVCSSVTADVTDENQVSSMVRKTLCDFGRIDILINNAGVGILKPIWECSSADWDYVMDTNLKGYFLCSKAVIPIMKKQNEGYILNIASGAGRQGIENLSIYCASKFGTIGLSESMKKDLWKFGIQVDYICPGYVKTDFFKEVSTRLSANAYRCRTSGSCGGSPKENYPREENKKICVKSLEALVEFKERDRSGHK